MSKGTDGTDDRSGFFAETAQIALASYMPSLPAGQTLEPYLRRLITEARTAVEVARPAE